MKKRVIALLLTFILAGSLMSAAVAGNLETQSASAEIRVFVDGRPITTTVKPFISNGRTLIPIRAVTEAIGAQVDWDSASRTVTITRAAKEIVMVIDEEYALVDDEQVKLDVAPCIVNNTTFLPLRFVSEQFSQRVDWNSAERTVMISEDMRFAHEDANIKEWIIGCGAILAKVNRQDPYSIGMNPRSAANAATARRALSGSWGCEDRWDVIMTIFSMTDGGHAENFRFDAELANSFSDAEFKELLEMSGEVDQYMWPLVKALSAKWGDRGIKAWDWFRMCHLAGWGYLGGYLELEEVYILVEAVAIRLASTFSSWDEATENYMDGYAYWSRTDVSKENTSYKQRLNIYEDLKAAQKTDGLLFDPDVWSQPVKGIIETT